GKAVDYNWAAPSSRPVAQATALACRQIAAAAATLSDSSPPGWSIRTDRLARAISAALTPCPSCPSAQAQGIGSFDACSGLPTCELVTMTGTFNVSSACGSM